MVTYDEAKKIILSHLKKKSSTIVITRALENSKYFVFDDYETDASKINNDSDAIFSTWPCVNKSDGSVYEMSFLEHCDAIDDGLQTVENIDVPLLKKLKIID